MPNDRVAHPLSGPLVVVLAYDRLCTFEFGVAYEVFGLHRPEMGPRWYRFQVACAETGPLHAAGGLTVQGDGGLDLLQQADLIIVPGWRDIDAKVPIALVQALQQAHRRGAKLVSLCSGVFVLAATNLLNGQRATTHWRYTAALAQRYPEISVEPDVLYIDNGQILTAAGSAAGIDLCLHVVRQDYGSEASNMVARRLVVPPHRDGGQAQFIPRPVPVQHEGARLGSLLEWIGNTVTGDLSVMALAKRTGMSPRTFQRRFEDTTGLSPGAYVLQVRLERAQTLLEAESDLPLDTVAALSGFGSAGVMRHHFRRRLQISPKIWRDRFGTKGAADSRSVSELSRGDRLDI